MRIRIRDKCPNGDFSPSYYDYTCEALSTTDDPTHNSAEENSEPSSEFLTAYQWAHKYSITTMESLEEARIADAITRAEMAKVISVYAKTFMEKKPNVSKFTQCLAFSDMWEVNSELQFFILEACELGLMGYYANGIDIQPSFRPNDTITRAEV